MTPAPRTVFVTGSGTEVGKTFVCRVLIAQLRRRGLAVQALKPVATGFAHTPPEATDSAHLLRATGLELRPENMAAITPWAFAEPLSPDMAAAREGRDVPFEALVDFSRRTAANVRGVTLIEGIGGVMTPLDAHHTVLDWIAALGVPAMLVTGSYLGTLTHTLTAAGMLTARGCRLASVVVSESVQQPVSLRETAEALARFLGNTPVCALPRLAEADPELAPDLVALLGEDWRAEREATRP